MRQLTFIKPGKLEWWDVPVPRIEAGTDALVRPLAVARCDLDAAILAGQAPFRGALLHFLRNHLPAALGQRRLFRNAPFKGPYAFGHEGVAEVIEVGDQVGWLQPGMRVIVPFQISCGHCDRCRRGLTNSCRSVPPRAMFGFGDLGGRQWGGLLSDAVRVPFAEHMLVPVPRGLPPSVLASASDNIPDGYRTVAAPLKREPAAPVLVLGGGAMSVGLYAAGIAVALGSERVDYVDTDAGRLQIAQSMGANPVQGPPPPRLGPYPITVDASADPAGLSCALLSTAPGGTSTSVGIYYTPTTPLPLLGMYGIGLHFITGRVNASACIPDVLSLITAGRFDPQRVTGLTAKWNEAPLALLDPCAKVVVER